MQYHERWCCTFFRWGTRRKIVYFVCGFGHEINYFSALFTGDGRKEAYVLEFCVLHKILAELW